MTVRVVTKIHAIYQTPADEHDEAHLYGPFRSDEEACEWAAAHLTPGTWHYLAEMLLPTPGTGLGWP